VLSWVTAPAGPAEKGEGLVEEHLGLEASETRVILDETVAAEAQDEPGALGGERCPTDLQAMGRGVMLHLLPRGEVVMTDPRRWLLTQLQFAHPVGQGAVGDLSAVLFTQQFLHPHHIPLGFAVECGQLRVAADLKLA